MSSGEHDDLKMQMKVVVERKVEELPKMMLKWILPHCFDEHVVVEMTQKWSPRAFSALSQTSSQKKFCSAVVKSSFPPVRR